MKRQLWFTLTLIALIVLVGASGGPVGAVEIYPPEIQQTQPDNLLVNPGMEDGFYWEPPNHFVANGWLRWWVGNGIPEYDDVRAWRPWRYDGEHAQVYFRWGVPYTAGIYQKVNVRPCTYYRFTMYGRNHSGEGINHHAKIGIDPLGRDYGLYMSSLPGDVVWSPEKTYFYTWGLHEVEAESRSDWITVITYVSPDSQYTPYDTFWDAGTLTELPPPPGRLPEPSDWTPTAFIGDIKAYFQDNDLIIEWKTAGPATSQIWYDVKYTPLWSYKWHVYLPLVMSAQHEIVIPDLPQYTPADTSDRTEHRAVIEGLYWYQQVTFVVLARHLVGGECVTEASTVHISTFWP